MKKYIKNLVNRRSIISTGLLASAATLLVSCKDKNNSNDYNYKIDKKNIFNFKMVTTWPKDFPGLGTSANRLANKINKASLGLINIKVFGSGELVPAYEAFDAVRNGVADMCHDSPYYWLSKHPATAFFSTLPAGLSASEQTSWLLYGGGLELWHELYENFNLMAFPSGNAGLQMFGWFKEEINSLKDLKGLKVRMSGIHAEVLNRIGAITVNIPGGEIMTSLQAGVVDGVEWGGPWMDLAFGFHKIAPYCYGPGLHEPGLNTSLNINKDVYSKLPQELKNIIKLCCLSEISDSLAEFNFRNALLYQELSEKYKVKFKKLPNDVIKSWVENSEEVIKEISNEDKISKKIYESWFSYRENAKNISQFYDLGFLQARKNYSSFNK